MLFAGIPYNWCFYGEGKITGAVIVLYDISELHNLENIRRDFVANVSHELKTPLTAIRGLLETVIDNDNMTTADRKRFMENARDQSLRRATLVTDILTLAKLESDTAQPDKTVLDLNEIVSTTLESFNDSADAKNLGVDCSLDDLPLQVTGNEEALSSAIGNLLDNAIKYTPDGGEINLRLSQSNGNALIEVEDFGFGIDPKHHKRIFERFYRVDKARSRVLGGTGLGLSIVKHVAITHGGGVSLTSTPGEGSLFTITLPLL